MNSPENNLDLGTKQFESADKKRQQDLIEHAERIISGEFPYSETLYDDLMREMKGNTTGLVEGSDASIIWELLGELPKSEVNNCIIKAQKFISEGNIQSAESWQTRAEDRVRLYEISALDPKDVLPLQTSCRELAEKIDTWKNKTEQDSKKESALLRERKLFEHFLGQKLAQKNVIPERNDLSLAEQIKQLSENGMIEDISLDMKTGRIHFKYKPKQRSLLNSFVNWVMEYDSNRAKKILADAPHFGKVDANRFGGAFSSKERDEYFARKHQHILDEQMNANSDQDDLSPLEKLGIKVEKNGENVSIIFEQESPEGNLAAETLLQSIENNDKSKK